MTDDIVIRLRELLDGPVPMSVERQDVREAADEIERLRAEINSMASAQAGWGRVARLEAEIELLRAAGDALYELVSVRLIIPADQHDDAVEQIRKWKEARRG